jgi:putative ABC transport system substrate-binding protein
MRRRAFLGALATGLAAPRQVLAQRVARIGYLALHPLGSAPQETAFDFLKGLRELGYVENQNMVIDFRNGGGRAETLVDRARELVATGPDVIVAYGAVDVQAVLQATRTIPVVMIYAPDPVALGFAASLARPGGNVTGLSRLAPELTAKRLELLREVRPGLARVAVLWDLGLGPIDRLDQLGWRHAGAMQSLASSRI